MHLFGNEVSLTFVCKIWFVLYCLFVLLAEKEITQVNVNAVFARKRAEVY